jgi:hypothetical protein
MLYLNLKQKKTKLCDLFFVFTLFILIFFFCNTRFIYEMCYMGFLEAWVKILEYLVYCFF